MSESSGSEYTCQLCEKTSSSKEDITLHLQKHLGYKKYPCDGCSLSFFTEAEREKHCTTSKHVHAFRFNINQYNEMLLAMLLKDMELLKVYDFDVIVAQRAKVNAEFDSAIQKRSKNAPKPPKMNLNQTLAANNSPSTPSVPKKKSILKAATPEATPPAKAPAVEPVPVVQTPVAREPRSEESRERKRQRRESTNVPRVEKQTPMYEKASDVINASLTTQITADVKCRLCSVMVPSDYVSRKHHVSMMHMDTEHDDSDYVERLENKMREAFEGMTFSDLQCQWNNCGKDYKSDSGRRNHFHTHHNKPLQCPFDECLYQDIECNKMKNHLRECHNLPDGFKSMPDSSWKSAFEQAFREQNRELEITFNTCFPCSIPNSVKNYRNTARLRNSNTMIDVLRSFQKPPPSRPFRRKSESSESESESEKSAQKTPEVTKKKKDKVVQSANKAGSSKESSDEEEEETLFEDIKSVPLLPKSTKEKAPEKEGKDKKDKAKEKKPPAQEVSSASSEDDIVCLTTKNSKKSRKVRQEEEIKKEEEQDDEMTFPSANSSVEGEKDMATDEEVKEEVVVEKTEEEEVVTKEGDGGKRKSHREERIGSPVPKRHAPDASARRRDRLSSTSKSDSRGDQNSWHHNQPHQPRERRVSHNEDHRNNRHHAPSRSRWDRDYDEPPRERRQTSRSRRDVQYEEPRQHERRQASRTRWDRPPTEEHHRQQEQRPFGCPPPPDFSPSANLQRPRATGIRKKGSEMNFSLENPRPSYAIFTAHK